MSWSVLHKNQIVVFEVKITVKVNDDDDNNNNNEVFERPFSIEPKALTTNKQKDTKKLTGSAHKCLTSITLPPPSRKHARAHTHTHTHMYIYTRARTHTHISQITQSMFEKA